MSYQHQSNGNGWPPHQSMPRTSMPDLAKGGLNLGWLGTIFSAVFAAGVLWGGYRADMNTLTTQVAELKADVREIKATLPALHATLAEIKAQPRWTMHVDKR